MILQSSSMCNLVMSRHAASWTHFSSVKRLMVVSIDLCWQADDKQARRIVAVYCHQAHSKATALSCIFVNLHVGPSGGASKQSADNLQEVATPTDAEPKTTEQDSAKAVFHEAPLSVAALLARMQKLKQTKQ